MNITSITEARPDEEEKMGKKATEGLKQQLTQRISKSYVTTQDEYKNIHELLIMSLNARSINNNRK